MTGDRAGGELLKSAGGGGDEVVELGRAEEALSRGKAEEASKFRINERREFLPQPVAEGATGDVVRVGDLALGGEGVRVVVVVESGSDVSLGPAEGILAGRKCGSTGEGRGSRSGS